MDRKYSSKAWTGKVPPDSYYRGWANRLGLTTPLGFAVQIGVVLIVVLIGWLTHA